MTTFEVGAFYIHTNGYGDKMRVMFRGNLDSLTAVVYEPKSGGQFSVKAEELSTIEEDLCPDCGHDRMLFHCASEPDDTDTDCPACIQYLEDLGDKFCDA